MDEAAEQVQREVERVAYDGDKQEHEDVACNGADGVEHLGYNAARKHERHESGVAEYVAEVAGDAVIHCADEAGNYAEALYWKDETLRLKDTLLSVRNSSGISHTPMINYSQILLLIIICLFTFSLISLFLYFRHRKLKVQYEKLSETIKHREWSFMMTKEFITENHIAYDELERLLNREKSLHHLSSESYKRLYEALIQQKANSSGRLIYRLTNFDGNFSIRFQRMFPECNTDELLLASMIHHQWRMTDMTTIFHASPEALRKRKNRLAHKISTKLQKEIDLDEFLKNL